MRKHVLGAILWWFAAWYAWAALATVTGLPDAPGFAIGILAAALFVVGYARASQGAATEAPAAEAGLVPDAA